MQRLSEGLAARGHEVAVATSRLPGRRDETVNGVRIVSFEVSGNHARGMRGELGRYQAWLRDHRFDVVLNYAAQSWPTDAALPILRQIPGARILATCGFSGMFGLRRVLYHGYFRMLAKHLRDYDGLIFHGRTGRDIEFGRRHGTGRQAVIPNGADGAEFDAAPRGFRDRYGIHSRYLLLHVGNHYLVKGHDDLIRIARALRDLDVTLVIIGEPGSGWRGCWAACEEAARGDERLRLLRGLPRAEVVAAFREADVFLLASRFEAAPLVLVEAMAAGIPFVSYDVGNARELAGGIVVGWRRAMAEAVRDLLGDPARRHELGERGREMQRHDLEWERLIDRYEAFYTALVGSKQPPHG